MKLILDNIIFTWQKSGGVSVFWKYLLEMVLTQFEKDLITCYEYPHATENIVRASIHIPQHLLRQKSGIAFPIRRYCNLSLSDQKGPFIFHSSYYRISTHPKAINVVTVHDFTYEKFASGLKRLIHTRQKRKALHRAQAIVCVSDNTKKDLLKYFPEIPSEKISVIHNGVDKSFRPLSEYEKKEAQKRLALQQPFLLFVGSRAPYKQFAFALRVAAQIDMPLLIVGAPLTPAERKDVEQYKVDHIVRSYVSNQELIYYYSLATVLLYPSSYEGFGIPVIEAQRCQCPVIAYKASSIPEVLGEYPFCLEQLDIQIATAFIQKLRTDPSYLRKVQQAGVDNAQRFSWEKMQQQYAALYRKLWESYAV